MLSVAIARSLGVKGRPGSVRRRLRRMLSAFCKPRLRCPCGEMDREGPTGVPAIDADDDDDDDDELEELMTW